MSVALKKKAVAKKKAAPKKKVAAKKKVAPKKKVARMGLKRTVTTEVMVDTKPELPKVVKTDTQVPKKDVEKYEDGFVMTIIIAAAAAAVALALWMVNA